MKRWVETYADILHIYFTPYFSSLSAEELEKVAPKSWIKRLKIIAVLIKRRLFNLFKPSVPVNSRSKLLNNSWLFVLSLNNKRTLDFLRTCIPESVYILDKERPDLNLPSAVVPVLRGQIFYLPLFFVLYFWFLYKHGRYVRCLSVIIFKSCGYYEEWRRILRANRPKAIVFANDHNIESRALLLAAKSLGIKTIYIQHASVSDSFPPLRFGLSLLEGQDALDKYTSIESYTGQVKLIGMPKFDRYVDYRRKREKINCIGIPYNLNDDPDEIRKLVKGLRELFPEKEIILRRHPKDKSTVNFQEEFPFVVLSDPYVESSFDFLLRVDMIMAGNSSIHLEATLLNIPSVYINLAPNSFIEDYYGYVRNKLVFKITYPHELKSIVDHLEYSHNDLWPNARYFNAVVGTPDEGNSETLACQYVKAYLKMP